mmetsp:Transcript_28734/g.39758  ORF Transcript_28734/g.39758 Transcript_28734/m.39758 type:complete len:95 (+) Transcript_28734:5861-6145(+)
MDPENSENSDSQYQSAPGLRRHKISLSGSFPPPSLPTSPPKVYLGSPTSTFTSTATSTATSTPIPKGLNNVGSPRNIRIQPVGSPLAKSRPRIR